MLPPQTETILSTLALLPLPSQASTQTESSPHKTPPPRPPSASPPAPCLGIPPQSRTDSSASYTSYLEIKVPTLPPLLPAVQSHSENLLCCSATSSRAVSSKNATAFTAWRAAPPFPASPDASRPRGSSTGRRRARANGPRRGAPLYRRAGGELSGWMPPGRRACRPA